MNTRKRREWNSSLSTTGGGGGTGGVGAGSTINKKSALSAAYAELGKELTSGKLRSVGTYTLGRPIGEGTYGKVRLGTHRLTGTRVAIKQVPKAHSANLTREIHHHRRLHHPHIMQLYEVLATESCIWMATELCAGGELYDYLVERGMMPEPEARRIFGQLCLAVAYCHDRGIVHRDLKLENVLLDERCNVKLGDFGFTREFEAKKLMETFCGTTGYAAPEMLAGRRYTGEEVDVWSLGVILYALVCGALPFDDDDEAVMKAKILHGEFALPVEAGLSEECSDLIKKILQQEPTERPRIKQILAHPWFNKFMLPLTGMETVNEDASVHDGDSAKETTASFLKPDTALVPMASPNIIKSGDTEMLTDEVLHKKSLSGLSETTSFFSAQSKSDSDASDQQSQQTDTTNATTEEGDDDRQHPAHDDAQQHKTITTLSQLKQRNESQTTIKRQTSAGSDASRKAAASSSGKPAPSPLPTHVEYIDSELGTHDGDEAFTPQMAMSVPLEKRGSQSSSRGGHHRTPSRTKRRSSGGLSDHHPPSIDVKPIDYLALLQQSTPAIFSTVVEQNLLHQLSALGMDVGQIVHSVVNEACDASGAMWWILKKKAEEKAAQRESSGEFANWPAYVPSPSGSQQPGPSSREAGRPRYDSDSSQKYAAHRTSPIAAHRELIRPTAVKALSEQVVRRDAKTGPDGDTKQHDASVMTQPLSATPLITTTSSASPPVAAAAAATKPQRPGETRGRANSLGMRLSQVLSNVKDKDKERSDALITIGADSFALEERSKSPVVGGLFKKSGGDRSGNSPSPASTPKSDKKKDARSALQRQATSPSDNRDATRAPIGRSSASGSPSVTPRKGDAMALKASQSVDTFSTISSNTHTGDGSMEAPSGKSRAGKSSFLHTVRNWLGTDDKGKEKERNGGTMSKKKRRKHRSTSQAGTVVGSAGGSGSAAGTMKRPPSVHMVHSVSPTITRSGSQRRSMQMMMPPPPLPPSAYSHGSISRSPRMGHRTSLSRRSSSGSVQYAAVPSSARPRSVRRPSAGSITPTTTSIPLQFSAGLGGMEEFVMPYRGSRPSSAQSLHRAPGSASATLRAKSGSTDSAQSFVRLQSHGSGGYSGSLRGIHARRPSADGGTTVRRHRNYPPYYHARSESGSRSRPTTPSRSLPFEEAASMDTMTPRRSYDSARASSPSALQTPRAGHSVFVAHRSRTPYKPPSANPSLLLGRQHEDDDREWVHGEHASGLAAGHVPHHARPRHPHASHASGPAFGTWRRSWGKPPPSWNGPVDQATTGANGGVEEDATKGATTQPAVASAAADGDGKLKLRDVFANRESDDDWEDEEDDEPTYAGGLGQLASSTWGADSLGVNGGRPFGSDSRSTSRFDGTVPTLPSSAAAGYANPLMSSGRYAGVRGLFQPPSLGRETMPRSWVASLAAMSAAGEGGDGGGPDEAGSAAGVSGTAPMPIPTSSQLLETAPMTKDAQAAGSSSTVPTAASSAGAASSTGSRVRSAAPTFKGPVTIEEEEEDE